MSLFCCNTQGWGATGNDGGLDIVGLEEEYTATLEASCWSASFSRVARGGLALKNHQPLCGGCISPILLGS